jgi:TatA/E family protein of Tat protein translocase
MGHTVTMDMVCASLAFIDGLGGPEMILIFVIVLVLFGGQKLPEFARGFGKSIREFKKAAAGVEEEFKRALEEDERKTTAKLAAASAVPETTPDPAGPEAGVHSPVNDDDGTGESEHSTDDSSAAYDEGYPSDDVPPDKTAPSAEELEPPFDEVTPPSGDEPGPLAENDPAAPEPKILPPETSQPAPASAPPKAPPTPPAPSSLENPS